MKIKNKLRDTYGNHIKTGARIQYLFTNTTRLDQLNNTGDSARYRKITTDNNTTPGGDQSA